MAVLFRWHNVSFPKLSCLFLKTCPTQLKTEAKLMFDNNILGVITHKNNLKFNTECLSTRAKFSLSTHIFASCTIGMIGNITGTKMYGVPQKMY